MTYTAKIYKIVNTINDDFYIGSSKNELRKRWMQHKHLSKKKPEMNMLYEMLNQHDISCFRIVLCHEFDCENKEHQIKEEQKFIDELKPKLNKINSSGNKCEHNKLRSKCKECKGGSICIHNRQKSFCKECGGSEICEHNQYKSKCKDCGGSQICIHDRQKSQCKECKGSQICEHNQYKSRCKECKGSQICVHDKIKSRCRECGGSCTQKVKCECGSEVRKDGMIKHMKTKKHQDFIHPEK